MRIALFAGVASSLALGGVAAARPVVDSVTDTSPLQSNVVVDGHLSPNEYGPNNSYTFLGGGGGFGGTLGNGAIYMDQDANNLYIGFRPGNFLNDNVVIFLDTRAGGFNDADMNDTADGGRNVSSNLTRDSNDAFDPNFLPDYTLVVGAFGQVSFQLNAGNTPGHLIFEEFSGAFTGNDPNLFREFTLSKSRYNIGNGFRFLAGYISDSGFTSDETIPAQPFTGLGNIGFADPNGRDVRWTNYNEFNKLVPTPGAAMLLALGGLATARRRRA